MLIFQPHKTPAGWPAEVRPELPLKFDLVPRNEHAEQEQECNYLEQVHRNVYTEPTPMNEEVLEPELKTPLVKAPPMLQGPEPESTYEPIGGMEELE